MDDETPGLRPRLVEAFRPYYAEPFRRYHDLSHPLEMLAEADARGLRLSDAQVAAIVSHDAVNVAGFRGNEAASAALLLAWAPHLGLSHAAATEAAAIVRATDHAGGPAPDGADVVLDLDLLRLAVPYPDFLAHSRAVHHEWRHLVPDTGRFMAGRAGFFRTFLARPRIYRTGLPEEGVARETLAAFIAEWGAPAG